MIELALWACFWVFVCVCPVLLEQSESLNAHLRRLMPGPEDDE